MNKGFTLIELLVVVLIIGILAAIALPQYTKAVERSRMAEAMQILGDLATAESIYYMHHGDWAKTDAALNNGDITFPALESISKSFTIDISAAPALKATRKDGMYADSFLTLTVGPDGSITKTCSGETAFCNLAATAGYGVAATPVPANS